MARFLLPQSIETVRIYGKRSVKMDGIGFLAFAFSVGLTAGGLAGTAMEAATGRPLAFAEPYVSARHLVRSLAAVAVAGPFMLANDALAARRGRRISLAALAGCGATALAWALALGLVILSLPRLAGI